ncbi:MAG: glutamate--tRNA ligase [Gemmatimonadota bacterium]
MTVRTRFAPSPTGRLHLGNVRAAVFNWLFARHHGGAFILRVEDTDVERNVEGGEAALMEDLRWLGLTWDEGPDVGGPHAPYRQSGRDRVYRAALEELRTRGRAYPCYCTDEELEAMAQVGKGGRTVHRYDGRCRNLDDAARAALEAEGRSAAYRFALPEGLGEVVVVDQVFGTVRVPAADLDDFILLRRDGRPTYNFAVVADDAEMEITHVIRGVGHLSNTPKQVLLFQALDREPPVFAHLPTVLGPDGRKLSKREGSASVEDLRDEGFPPHAIVNYVSLLGWSHPEEKEVLTPEQLIAAVSLERVGRSDTQMDPEKLRWLSAQHIAREPLEELTDHVVPFVDGDRFPQALAHPREVVDALRSRLSTYGDINRHLPLLFPPETEELLRLRRRAAADPLARTALQAVRDVLERAEPWTDGALGAAVREAGARAGVKGRRLFHPLRTALIGSETGPDIGKILAAIGRKEALRRLDQALEGSA